MKKIIFFITLVVMLFSGCTRTVYVYPEQNMPTLEAPNKVVSDYDSYIYKRCLFINDNNTSLCGSDLNKVITTVKKLRINESTCEKSLRIYNEYKQIEKNQARKEDEFSFWF